MTQQKDEILAIKAQAGEEEATNELLVRYKNLINKLARSYFLMGGDVEDIIQEGMIGLYKAIMRFEPQKNASFKTFATTCVKHQIQTAIKSANAEKNKVLTSALSITDTLPSEEDDKIEFELLSELPSPDDTILQKEKFEEIKKFINNALSPLEIKILSLYLKGYSYNEISQMAGISKKSIDNGLSRIKNKLSFLKEKN